MADMKKAYEMYLGGFSCGQIVATFCSEMCGFDEKVARAALGSFGGGIHRGEVCSAVVGGLYSLGMYCNHCEYNDEQAKDKIEKMTEKYIDGFLDEYGSLCCRDLCKESDLHKCGDYINKTEELVRSLIEDDKKAL